MVQVDLSNQNKRLFQGEPGWGENNMAEVCWEREAKPEDEECGERVEALSSFQELKNKLLHKKKLGSFFPKAPRSNLQSRSFQ